MKPGTFDKADGRARNPHLTRERILSVALREFAAKGYFGAHIDRIARRARINKRMVYHYFGDKRRLFREVLRQKMAEHRLGAEKLSGDLAESLSFWFAAACEDKDWIRLLEWEALQDHSAKLVDEQQRREAMARGLERIRQYQAQDRITADLDPRHVMLAMWSLSIFPAAFPQLTRLIAGRSPSDPQFQSERAEFLRKFAAAFQPAEGRQPKSIGEMKDAREN